MATLTRPRHVLPLAGLLAAATAACTTAPITGRKQLDLVSDSTMNQLGLQQYQQELGQAKKSSDPALNAQVQRVAERVAAAAEREFHPKYQWQFSVIDDPKTVNAWCLPGGKIAVYTGILPLTQTDAGLATVLSHEIAHALAHHGAERLSRMELMQLGEMGILAAVQAKKPGATQVVGAALGLGAQLGVELPFSREQESEADHIGLILMAKAGYDPTQALDFWSRMAAYSKGKEPPQFLSDHPSTETRIADLRKEMPEAERAYASAPHGSTGAAPVQPAQPLPGTTPTTDPNAPTPRAPSGTPSPVPH